jgi:preprotein translocase subunit YajC
MEHLFILLQAPNGGGVVGQLLLWGGIILVFYFFMIRPQQKKQKDQKVFTENLTKGQSVVTIGGIHGKILSTDKETLVLEVDKGTKLVVERSAISQESSKRYNDSVEK